MKSSEILSIRRRYRWTQSELAERLGTDSVTVSRWERGVSQPRPSAEVRLKELIEPLPDDLRLLIKRVGTTEARRLLQRPLLLKHPLPRARFVESPTKRLKAMDRALREQMEFKSRARLSR